jgi:hypothetical protein
MTIVKSGHPFISLAKYISKPGKNKSHSKTKQKGKGRNLFLTISNFNPFDKTYNK